MGTEEEIRQAIQDMAVDGKAACSQLLAIAERTGTPAKEVGRVCDEMDIRIRSCQLGCFR